MSTLGMRPTEVLKKGESESKSASHTFRSLRYWEEPLVPEEVPKAQPWEPQAKPLRDVKGKVVSTASIMGQEDEQNEEEEKETKPTRGFRDTTRPLPHGTLTDPLGQSPAPRTASQRAKTDLEGKPERDSPKAPQENPNKKEPSPPDFLRFWTWKWSGPHPISFVPIPPPIKDTQRDPRIEFRYLCAHQLPTRVIPKNTVRPPLSIPLVPMMEIETIRAAARNDKLDHLIVKQDALCPNCFIWLQWAVGLAMIFLFFGVGIYFSFVLWRMGKTGVGQKYKVVITFDTSGGGKWSY